MGLETDCGRLELSNQLCELERLSTWLDRLMTAQRIAEEQQFEIKLCTYEATANIIFYAYDDHFPHAIEVRIEFTDHTLSIYIVDDGKPFNPCSWKEHEPAADLEFTQISGRGISIMRALSTGMRYNRIDNKNALRLDFCIYFPTPDPLGVQK